MEAGPHDDNLRLLFSCSELGTLMDSGFWKSKNLYSTVRYKILQQNKSQKVITVNIRSPWNPESGFCWGVEGRSYVNDKRWSFVSVVGNDRREQRNSTNIRQIYFRRSLKVSGQFHHDKTTHVLLTETSKILKFRKNCFRSHSWNGFIDLESKLKTCQPFSVLWSMGFLDCFINISVLCPSKYQPHEHH